MLPLLLVNGRRSGRRVKAIPIVSGVRYEGPKNVVLGPGKGAALLLLQDLHCARAQRRGLSRPGSWQGGILARSWVALGMHCVRVSPVLLWNSPGVGVLREHLVSSE